MEIIIIAALSENGVIGIDNKLPWHFKEDLQRFRELTIGFPVIMGRKTFESIGKPLAKRQNIVVTRDVGYIREGVVSAYSINDALDKAEKYSNKVFIIGGAQLYKEFLPIATRMELTKVHSNIEGDTYYPEYKSEEWEETVRHDFNEFSFISYKRKAL